MLFILPSNHLIREGHQIGQSRFAVSEAVLAVTNHLISHVPQHSFQENLLYVLARHQGEIDLPVFATFCYTP